MNPASRTRLNVPYVAASGEAADVGLLPAGDVTDGVVRAGGTVRHLHEASAGFVPSRHPFRGICFRPARPSRARADWSAISMTG